MVWFVAARPTSPLRPDLVPLLSWGAAWRVHCTAHVFPFPLLIRGIRHPPVSWQAVDDVEDEVRAELLEKYPGLKEVYFNKGL